MNRRNLACAALAALLAGGLCLQAAAAATPPGAPRWLEANGVSLRYEINGTGPSTVVLLHEIGMTLEGWDEVVPMIDSGRRVLRYDLRGFGLSEKILGPLTLDDEVQDLRGLLDGLNIRGPVTLVGGALGASIALRFAARFPQRVRALVLISPIFNGVPNAPRTALPPRPPAGASGGNIDTATIIEKQGIRAYLTAQQVDMLYPEVKRTNPERLQRFWGIELSGDPVSRATTVRMISRSAGVGDDLAKIHCPTLVAATALFALRPPATVKAIADAISGAQFKVLQAGHLAALESPELVGPMLQQFLRQTGG